MCGIAGQYYFQPRDSASLDQIKIMTDSIRHRGPDGDGHYFDKYVGMGHRRLAIIDLNYGAQPMFSEDGSICITYNGELYNYIELRDELRKYGVRFHTESDTEVIIQSYLKWGIECLNKFNGMWAFALWDNKNQTLYLTRDRIGEKPLYYYYNDNKVIWGSEIKTIIAGGVSKELNDDVLGLYLALGFMPAPYSLIKGIHNLEPGSYVEIKGSNIRKEKYWTLPQISENDLLTDKKIVEKHFQELFIDSVRLRMRSDVGFGAFLSGGLDSGSVVAVMQQFNNLRTETFTIGFKNKEYDERNLANEVAKKFSANFNVKCLEEDVLEKALEYVSYHFDEPFSDPSAIPTGHVSEFASKYVKMVLTGDGGDEVLSGYTIYKGEKFAAKYQRIPSFMRQAIPAIIEFGASPLKGKVRFKLNRMAKVLRSSNLSFEERLYSKICRTNPDNLRDILPNNKVYETFLDFYTDVMKDCKFKDPFYKLMHFQLKVTLPDNMLAKVDRMSMAHSLETRVPFLDYRLVEFMYGVHKDIKMKGYENKSILRNTIGKELPKSVLDGAKKGFNVPLRDWFMNENNQAFVTKKFYNYPSTKYFEKAKMERFFESNRLGRSDEGNLIWRIMLLNKCFES